MTPEIPATFSKQRSRLRQTSFWILTSAFVIIIFSSFGTVPSRHLNSLGGVYSELGFADSLARNGLYPNASHVAYPNGTPIFYGTPLIELSAVFIKLLNIHSVDARTLACAIALLISFFGATQLMRTLGANSFVALVCAFSFLSTSLLWGHVGYGPLPFAFALLPTFILFDFFVLKQTMSKKWAGARGVVSLSILAFLAIAVRCIAIFMDGYIFVIWSLVSVILVVLDLYQQSRNRQCASALVNGSIVAVSLTASYVFYKSFTAISGSFATMPADYFRAQGVDIISLFLPAPGTSLLLSWLGTGYTYDKFAFFGDGSNQSFNFLGYSLIFMTAGFFAFRPKQMDLRIQVIILSLVASLFLSLGPSIKFASRRSEPAPPDHRPTFSDYLMPASAARINLHTDFLYTKTPGLKNMRAIYRWLVLTKAAAVILAAIFITSLLKSRHRKWAVIAMVLLAVESCPPVFALEAKYRIFRQQLLLFDRTVIAPLQNHVPPESIVVFASSENDYLANYMAPRADIYCYNVGGDKNFEIAMPHIPERINEIRLGHDTNDNAFELMKTGELEYLVVPFFNLRWNSYSWPPSKQQVATMRDQALLRFDSSDNRFQCVETEYFLIASLNSLNAEHESSQLD